MARTGPRGYPSGDAPPRTRCRTVGDRTAPRTPSLRRTAGLLGLGLATTACASDLRWIPEDPRWVAGSRGQIAWFASGDVVVRVLTRPRSGEFPLRGEVLNRGKSAIRVTFLPVRDVPPECVVAEAGYPGPFVRDDTILPGGTIDVPASSWTDPGYRSFAFRADAPAEECSPGEVGSTVSCTLSFERDGRTDLCPLVFRLAQIRCGPEPWEEP